MWYLLLGCPTSNAPYLGVEVSTASDTAPVTDIDGDGYGSDVDCDDRNVLVHPDAWELCDHFDGDCNGILPNEELDDDHDSYMVCEGDCDDTDATVFPGSGC